MTSDQIRDNLLGQLSESLPNGDWFVFDPDTKEDLHASWDGNNVCTVEDEVEPGKIRRVRVRLSLELVSDEVEDDFAD